MNSSEFILNSIYKAQILLGLGINKLHMFYLTSNLISELYQ